MHRLYTSQFSQPTCVSGTIHLSSKSVRPDGGLQKNTAMMQALHVSNRAFVFCCGKGLRSIQGADWKWSEQDLQESSKIGPVLKRAQLVTKDKSFCHANLLQLGDDTSWRERGLHQWGWHYWALVDGGDTFCGWHMTGCEGGGQLKLVLKLNQGREWTISTPRTLQSCRRCAEVRTVRQISKVLAFNNRQGQFQKTRALQKLKYGKDSWQNDLTLASCWRSERSKLKLKTRLFWLQTANRLPLPSVGFCAYLLCACLDTNLFNMSSGSAVEMLSAAKQRRHWSVFHIWNKPSRKKAQAPVYVFFICWDLKGWASGMRSLVANSNSPTRSNDQSPLLRPLPALQAE